jgi:hypothetical protein
MAHDLVIGKLYKSLVISDLDMGNMYVMLNDSRPY